MNILRGSFSPKVWRSTGRLGYGSNAQRRAFSGTSLLAVPAKDSVAFIGLGVMGWPMAANLRKKMRSDQGIVIHDVDKAAISKFQEQFEDHGPIEVVSNGAEAYKAADTVITMLPSAEAMEVVYNDPKTGIFSVAAPAGSTEKKKLVIECGTVSQSTIWKVFNTAKAKDMSFVDAPVSGGPMGSQAGTLSFMVGCEEGLFPEIKALLLHMGKESGIVRCGEVGAGSAFKIINNYISILSVLTVSEALNIAAKMNLDMKLLVDVINSGSGRCWVTDTNNPVPGIHPNAPASHGYAGGFRIELAEKVLSLGKELAAMVGARTNLDKTALASLAEAAGDPRYAGKDARVVYKWLNEQ